ncbi:MAG: hypothetical protein IKD46_06825 [Lentisphaeria bacterium]|nr:hypothetical protein [Lentisphaeria bacterium]
MILPGKVWAVLLGGLLLMPMAEGANALSELRGLRTRESRIPVYNKERLQLLLYSAECFQKGRFLEMTAPVMDIIRSDADIDSIDTGKNTKVYPLGASFTDIVKFWSGHLFSDGVVVTGKADVDQENKLAAGGGKVYFRSPLLDLNGVGFDADYGKKTIFVRKDVNIVLRTAASDPLKSIKNGKMPEKYEFLRGTSDTLAIDMTKRLITLTGNVRVVEERGVITCERMFIVLPPEKDKKKAAKGDEMSIRGVSQVICEGRVLVNRTGGPELQQASGERMVYDLKKGLLNLTGTVETLPQLRQGGNTLQGRRIIIFRNSECMQVHQACKLVYFQKDSESGKLQPVVAKSDRMDFDNRSNLGVLTGNVRVADPRFDLECSRMDIRLAETGAPDKKQKAAVSEITGMPEFAPGGKKELKDMRCYGNVRLIRAAAPGEEVEMATAREAELTYPQQIVTLTGNRPMITKGRDSISGDKLTIDLNSQTLVAEPESRIVFNGSGKGLPGKGKNDTQQQTVVLADRADLRYAENLLIFTGNVKVQDTRMGVDCDRMEIYLKDASSAAGKTAKKVSADTGLSSLAGPDAKKQLEKILCLGNVKVRESRMKMDCDKLSLFFRQTAPGKTAAPGMFQSHGTELVYIHSDGNVVLENIPEKKTASAGQDKKKNIAAGMPSFGSGGGPMHMTADMGRVDLIKNISEFHGNVKVREEQGQLDCQDLYLYGKEASAAKAASAKAVSAQADAFAGLDSLDDDPFGKNNTKEVPQVIALGDGRELDRVVALKDVILVRKLASGGEQRATGQKAEYFVSRRLVELTGEAPEYAQVTDANPQNNGRGRKITVFLDRESVAFDGRVQMEFDSKKGTPGVGL